MHRGDSCTRDESNSEVSAEEVTGGRIVTPYDFYQGERKNKG